MEWNDWFYYDPTSESFLRWKTDITSGKYHNHRHVHKDDVAGCLNNSGYYLVKLKNKLYSCHRVIFEMLNGYKLKDEEFIDHIDGSRVNNDIQNLRVVSRELNTRNAKKRKDNTSGIVGVSRISNGCGSFYWSARCEDLDGGLIQKRFSIKNFGEEEAFRLACEFRKAEIAKLNTRGAGYTNRCNITDKENK